MEDRPDPGSEQPDPASGGEHAEGAASAPEGAPAEELSPEAQALAEEAAEIRRMVEEGAGSPEAIRELAARLREHRAREEELWRTAVKPVLVQQGKGRLRGHRKPPPAEPVPPAHEAASQWAWLGGGLLAVVAIVLLAASTSVWVLVLPVLALLAWAWHQGRDTPPSG